MTQRSSEEKEDTVGEIPAANTLAKALSSLKDSNSKNARSKTLTPVPSESSDEGLPLSQAV